MFAATVSNNDFQHRPIYTMQDNLWTILMNLMKAETF